MTKFRRSLPLVAVAVLGVTLTDSLPAQQVPNPVLPPVQSGDGLTRDGLDTPAAPQAPANSAPAPAANTHRAHGKVAANGGSKHRSYATIRRHRRHRRHKASATMVASNSPEKKAAKPRSPLVSFIYWWNGLVVRKFHTRSGTVMLDTIGSKS